MPSLSAKARKLVCSEDAALLLEYGLLVGLIALAVAASAVIFGGGLQSLWSGSNHSL